MIPLMEIPLTGWEQLLIVTALLATTCVGARVWARLKEWYKKTFPKKSKNNVGRQLKLFEDDQ